MCASDMLQSPAETAYVVSASQVTDEMAPWIPGSRVLICANNPSPHPPIAGFRVSYFAGDLATQDGRANALAMAQELWPACEIAVIEPHLLPADPSMDN